MRVEVDGEKIQFDELRLTWVASGYIVPFPASEDPNQDRDTLVVTVSPLGIVMNAYPQNGEQTQKAMTFEQWFKDLVPKPVNKAIARLQEKYAGEDGSELDEDIIEQASITATETNNSGIEAQIEELVQSMGEEAAEARLREIFER